MVVWGFVVPASMTDREGRSLIEAELVRLADGDPQKLWRLRKIQAGIDRELRRYKDPVARMNKMVELFWKGFAKFHRALNGGV